MQALEPINRCLLIQDYCVNPAGAIVHLLLGNSIFHSFLEVNDLSKKEFLKNFRSSVVITVWSDDWGRWGFYDPGLAALLSRI